MEHPFERWRKAHGIPTKTGAARALGLSPQNYNDITHGRYELSNERIRQVVRATDGEVTADDLVFWGEPDAAA